MQHLAMLAVLSLVSGQATGGQCYKKNRPAPSPVTPPPAATSAAPLGTATPQIPPAPSRGAPIVSRSTADAVHAALGINPADVSQADFFTFAVLGFSNGALSSANEWSALIANLAHESGNFRTTIEDGCESKCGNYAESVSWDGLVKFGADVANQCFCGRGYIQLSHTANYFLYSMAAFNGDGFALLRNPGQVATDSRLKWDSALWYWVNNVHKSFSTGDFAKSVIAINFPLECSSSSSGVADGQAKERFSIFRKVLAIADPSATPRMNCPHFSL